MLRDEEATLRVREGRFVVASRGVVGDVIPEVVKGLGMGMMVLGFHGLGRVGS